MGNIILIINFKEWGFPIIFVNLRKKHKIKKHKKGRRY